MKTVVEKTYTPEDSWRCPTGRITSWSMATSWSDT